MIPAIGVGNPLDLTGEARQHSRKPINHAVCPRQLNSTVFRLVELLLAV